MKPTDEQVQAKRKWLLAAADREDGVSGNAREQIAADIEWAITMLESALKTQWESERAVFEKRRALAKSLEAVREEPKP